jgi:protease I
LKLIKVLMPIPRADCDPSETGIPWAILKQAGIAITIATPDGKKGACDPKMLTGKGLKFLAPLLMADHYGVTAYEEMSRSPEFSNPLQWAEIRPDEFDGLLLPGGHAPGMKEYLESETLQNCVAHFFQRRAPVAAICHGTVLAARSKRADGKSVLNGYRTTGLLATQEMSAWAMTYVWLKNYYRTYPESVQSEVTRALNKKEDFIEGSLPLLRDNPAHLDRGFVLRDRHYLSARWPGDAHSFGHQFVELLRDSASK